MLEHFKTLKGRQKHKKV